MSTPGRAYDAVVLLGFGGPEGPDEVWPFLRRVVAGRGIPDERLTEVAEHYLQLGGSSPLPAQHRRLSDEVTRALRGRGLDTPVVIAHRNSAPFLTDVLPALHEAGHRRILALATSAFSSYSSCRQYREDLGQALEDGGLTELHVAKVRPFFDLDGVLEATVDALAAALEDAEQPGVTPVVLFTTHSLPRSMATSAGPSPAGAPLEAPPANLEQGPAEPPAGAPELDLYSRQHARLADAAVRELVRRRGDGHAAPRWRLVYQSRSGPPQVPWLEPDIADAIREEAAAGTAGVVVAPIGFLTDHVEVMWDLDTEARAVAEQVGVGFVRAATIGFHPAFVAAIADLVSYHLGAAPAPRRLPERDHGVDLTAGVCLGDCCPAAAPGGSRGAGPAGAARAARATRPAVEGAPS